MTSSPPPRNAKETVQLAISALQTVEQAVDGVLGAAINQLAEAIIARPGRVIVTGLGKSGHIAKKIAATLASTGTPAFFVHAAEANHGDLGMITKDDLVLAFSLSGQTRELVGITDYCQRNHVPLAAFTTDEGSPLAKKATYMLTIPAVTEACPLQLAPTTSSLVQLVIGDALAMTLLTLRNFSSDQFQNFHPGGDLGTRLLKVRDLMHTGNTLPLIHQDTPMPAVITEMSNKNFGCVGILNDQQCLVGIITDGDLRRNLDNDILAQTARDIMSVNPKTFPADNLATQALAYCQKNAIQALFILDQQKPVGLLHIHDMLKAGLV